MAKRTLDEKDIQTVFMLSDAGYTQQIIAKRFGVSQTVISRLLKERR